jgi:DNA-binding transcriptional MocR family regulator
MRTKLKHRHGGSIGRLALGVYHALAFDCVNYKSGRCDPSLDTIARRASCSRRAVASALARLQRLGIIDWQRRCDLVQSPGGRWQLCQRSNAYHLASPVHWRTHDRESPAPAPEPGTWGDHPPLPEALEAAAAAAAAGDEVERDRLLQSAEPGSLGAAIARLGQAIYRSASAALDPPPESDL